MSQRETVTARQVKAIDALLSASTITGAADQAGVSRRTLTRWMRDDDAFKAALTRAGDQAIDQAVRRLAGCAALAIDALESAVTMAATPVKVRAADVLLSKLLALREQHELTARIVALEERTNEPTQPNPQA